MESKEIYGTNHMGQRRCRRSISATLGALKSYYGRWLASERRIVSVKDMLLIRIKS